MVSSVLVQGLRFALVLITVCWYGIYISRVFRITPLSERERERERERPTLPEFVSGTTRGEIWCRYWARSLMVCTSKWYSTFFVRVPPDVISLQLCAPRDADV
jgi:hypothetical protein